MTVRVKATCIRLIDSKVVPNNFLSSYVVMSLGDIGYKIILSFKHRHYDIDGFSSDDEENSQGVMLSYVNNPFDENDKTEYCLDLRAFSLKHDEYTMIHDKEKDNLTLYFLNSKLEEKILFHEEVLIE